MLTALHAATVSAATPAVRSQPATMPAGARDVSHLIAPLAGQHEIPGMVAVVIRGGRVVSAGVTGVRRAGGDVPVTIDDRFHIGSDTKAMTATLCAMLVEEGKLAWTSTVADVFPDHARRMDAAWRGVTLEQLLTNRAGAPGDLLKTPIWAKLRAHRGTNFEARRLLMQDVTTRPPEAPPGTRYIYSNAGFAIAGHMAERATGRPWEQLMTERLFQPLGMSSAGFGAPGKPGAKDQPLGHTPAGKPVEPGRTADNPAAIGPAGSVHCSIADWAKFVLLHLQGEREQPEPGAAARLLKPATLRKLHEPVPGEKDYAMGWIVVQRPWAGGRALTHDGSNTMWYASAWLAPERGLAMLAVCNRGGDAAQKACGEAVSALLLEELGSGSPAKRDGVDGARPR